MINACRLGVKANKQYLFYIKVINCHVANTQNGRMRKEAKQKVFNILSCEYSFVLKPNTVWMCSVVTAMEISRIFSFFRRRKKI
jgi:hypothetical protein